MTRIGIEDRLVGGMLLYELCRFVFEIFLVGCFAAVDKLCDSVKAGRRQSRQSEPVVLVSM